MKAQNKNNTLFATDVHQQKHIVYVDELSWRVSVYGIIIRDDMILMSRQFGNKYDIPGGAVELTESFEEAVEREIREETGITARAVQTVATKENLFVWEPDNPDKRRAYHSILVFYLCEFVEGELSIDGFEEGEQEYVQLAEWLPLEKLRSVQQASSVDFYEIVQQALAMRNQ